MFLAGCAIGSQPSWLSVPNVPSKYIGDRVGSTDFLCIIPGVSRHKKSPGSGVKRLDSGMAKRRRVRRGRKRRGRRRLFRRRKRVGRAKLKFRVKGGQRPVNMLMKQPTMANRIVLRTAVYSDWVTTPFGGLGASLHYTFNMLTAHQPLVNLPTAPAQTYQGLSTYLAAADQFLPHYGLVRILYNKITVEVNRATSPTNSLEVVLLADPVPDGSAITFGALSYTGLMSQPYAKSLMIQNDAVGGRKLTLACSPRKLAGISKPQFTQGGFYALAGVDPTVALYWNLWLKPVNSNAEPSGTWAFRVRMDALVELSRQWSMPLSVN